MHSARVLSLQSRKCSIGSSWKSIITACIWNQRNTQMLRGTQASSIITGSLFHENKSVKITNKCTQVQIFLTYSLSKFYKKKNHGQNLLPEYCMEVLLHQQCKCHLGDHYFSPAIQSFKFRITAGMRPFPMYGRLHSWFLVLVFRGFPTEDCVISIGFSSVQLVFRICIRVRLNHSRDGTNDHCCIQLWFVSVGH